MESLINSDFLLGGKMIVDNKKIDISDLISQKYMHKEINKGIFLSDYQIDILMQNGIDPYKCGSINELLFLIDEILEEENIKELDIISKEIMEFNYYANTNK